MATGAKMNGKTGVKDASFDIRIADFVTEDGINIAVQEMGATGLSARPVILIHGFFSDAETNWIKYGHAALLASAGYRVIMPDLRAHGKSDKPHDPQFYTKDVLIDDQFALIEDLGLSDYDLAGYSLGGRTVARMLVRGAKPRRAIVAGMGLEGLLHPSERAKHFRHILTNLGNHERGSAAWMAEAFLKTTGGDPKALLGILDTFVDTQETDLAAIPVPVGIICGADDQDNGSAQALAALLPQSELITVPGNHMSAVAKPELGAAILAYLNA
jgi:pimeloyl-ACP methyl ester carboxylesterase